MSDAHDIPRLVPSPVSTGEGRVGAVLVAPLLLLLAIPAHAFEIERTEAYYADKHYQFEMVALLDAPVDRVEAVLRDYEKYTELDSRILAARVIERPESYVALLETIVRACFGPFCRNVKRTERVEESPLELAAVTDPARSDVRFGETRTMLSVSEGRTRVSYRTNIVPGFWIPPFVGRRWMLNTLEDATTDLFMNVEMKAKNPGPQHSAPELPASQHPVRQNSDHRISLTLSRQAEGRVRV